MDESEDKNLAAELSGHLLGVAQKAEALMSRDAVFTALLSAAVGYALQCGITEAGIRAHLRELADKLEFTEPPAPLVS